MRQGVFLEKMAHTEVYFYRKKQRLLHAHKMARNKISTQQDLLHQKIRQWEILEIDRINEDYKKNFISWYINRK